MPWWERWKALEDQAETTEHLLYLPRRPAGLPWCGYIRIRAQKPVKGFFSDMGMLEMLKAQRVGHAMASLPANSSRIDPGGETSLSDSTPTKQREGKSPIQLHFLKYCT